ncbi:Uncharacterised protein [uncultured archaeon]|nr:Uncharacterised protein [uncultured archaeon]
MSKRSIEFPGTLPPTMGTIPTGKLRTIQEKQAEKFPPKQDSNINPLTAFFRKSKLFLTLPSRGKWYPTNSLALDSNGNLPIFAMNAEDDIKLRTGDFTLSGENVFEVIRSCVPGIKQPENIPSIDLDAILLAIRVASYGAVFDFTVSVPNTTLTRTLSVNAQKLLAPRNEIWDDDLSIEDETGQKLSIQVIPIPVRNLFQTTKNIFELRKAINKSVDAEQNITNEKGFNSTMSLLAAKPIELICSSIQKLSLFDPNGNKLAELNAANPQDQPKIKQTIGNLDVAYFNAIKEHFEIQRKKFVFTSDEQTSTPKEINAGAPEKWTTELTFIGSNFLPEQK